MNWNTYLELFDHILEKKHTNTPYDNDAYLEYVQLNKVRLKRWLKKKPITDFGKETIERIDQPQKWYLITEPWCGDAAHITPIISMLAELNPNIDLKIVLRDSSDMIDSYLTNGGKSIPKLIVRDTEENDLVVWGPRPTLAQEMVLEMKKKDVSPQEKKHQNSTMVQLR